MSSTPFTPLIRRTYATFVLDSSISMSGIRDATIAHFNEQLNGIKEDCGKIEVLTSLFSFSNKVNPVFKFQQIGGIPSITEDDYQPNGGTALFDGIGEAVTHLKTRSDWDADSVSHLFLILTDGEENSSRKFTGDQVSEMIEDLQENHGWTFTWLCANQSVEDILQTNVSIGNVNAFCANTSGVVDASVKTRGGIRHYFSSMSSMSCSSLGGFNKKAKFVKSFYSPTI